MTHHLRHLSEALVVLALCTGSAGVGVRGAGAAPAHHVWEAPIVVRGVAAPTVSHSGGVAVLSCSSAGNCTAAGDYTTRSGQSEAFVTSEKTHKWGGVQPLGGTVSMATNVVSISCSSAGNCAIGGNYLTSQSVQYAFVANEVAGVWRHATTVPNPAAATSWPPDQVTVVSCGAPGNCAAVGTIDMVAVVISETGDVWGSPQPVADVVGVDSGQVISTDNVSCKSAGNCVVGGIYWSTTVDQVVGFAYTLTETNGVWGPPLALPGFAAMAGQGFSNFGIVATVDALTCTSVGNCVVGGQFPRMHTSDYVYKEAYLAVETNGVWANAFEVPDTNAMNVNGVGATTAIACTSNANCTAGGMYNDAKNNFQAFVAQEVNGVWKNAQTIRAMNATGFELSALSCGSPGNCAAIGDIAPYGQLASETNGVWTVSHNIYIRAPNYTVYANYLNAVACAGRRYCVVGGSYETSPPANQVGPARPVTPSSTAYVMS